MGTNNIKGLIIEPGKAPYSKDINLDEHELNKLVGGYLEAFYPFGYDVCAVINEEGKIRGLPLNRPVIRGDRVTDILMGTFVLVGIGDEDFASLTEEQIKKYTDYYSQIPEYYLRISENGLPVMHIALGDKTFDLELSNQAAVLYF